MVKLNAYAAYVRCRQIGATSVPFEQWADTVVSVVDMNNDPTDTEEQAETMNGPVPVSSGDMGGRAGFFDRCDRWDSGGFGELSCVLAARFGGTPWAWRRESQPQEADWGTCVSLLRQEAEETEDIRRRTR